MASSTVAGMPSSLHEVFVEFVRQRPAFAAEVLAGPLKVKLPEFGETRLDSIDFNDVAPTEYRADAVVTFTQGKDAVFAVVIEAQLSRVPEKRLVWPVYLTTLRARLNCTTALLVLCSDAKVANWCAQPIEVAYPGCVVTPLVLGPDRVPVITDVAMASSNPELTVLSALAHGGDPDRKEIFQALLAALRKLDRDHERLYYDLVFAGLPQAAQDDLKEQLMTMTASYEFRSDFLRNFAAEQQAEGQAKGEAQGEAKAVLTFLATRGIEVPDEARERITGCTDLAQLEAWVRRAVAATSVEDLFAL
jgi:hypothetical protein